MKPLQAAVAYSALAILVGAFPSHAPLAGGNSFQPIDAKPLIDACWALSKEDRDSGVTGRMRSGSARSIGCLEGVIHDQAEALFDEETLDSLKLKEQLIKLRKGYQILQRTGPCTTSIRLAGFRAWRAEQCIMCFIWARILIFWKRSFATWSNSGTNTGFRDAEERPIGRLSVTEPRQPKIEGRPHETFTISRCLLRGCLLGGGFRVPRSSGGRQPFRAHRRRTLDRCLHGPVQGGPEQWRDDENALR